MVGWKGSWCSLSCEELDDWRERGKRKRRGSKSGGGRGSRWGRETRILVGRIKTGKWMTTKLQQRLTHAQRADVSCTTGCGCQTEWWQLRIQMLMKLPSEPQAAVCHTHTLSQRFLLLHLNKDPCSLKGSNWKIHHWSITNEYRPERVHGGLEWMTVEHACALSRANLSSVRYVLFLFHEPLVPVAWLLALSAFPSPSVHLTVHPQPGGEGN